MSENVKSDVRSFVIRCLIFFVIVIPLFVFAFKFNIIVGLILCCFGLLIVGMFACLQMSEWEENVYAHWDEIPKPGERVYCIRKRVDRFVVVCGYVTGTIAREDENTGNLVEYQLDVKSQGSNELFKYTNKDIGDTVFFDKEEAMIKQTNMMCALKYSDKSIEVIDL